MAKTPFLALAVAVAAVTHGHLDHVGGLAELQSAFPEMGIIMHSNEAPYLVGPRKQQAKYSSVPSDNAAYTIVRSFLQKLLPQPEADPARTFLLSGDSGDVADARANVTAAQPAWLPPRGVLSFLRVPGHSPGQVALLHKPSGTLVSADVVMYGRGLAHLDADKLLELPFERLFPSHDDGTGVVPGALRKLVASFKQ
ncbi:hypothetical protein WJX81_001341 [Elliptochloris bilobata]|uniref:Metallo-beta-lactamase domain-containing protein n=1 Tax=Elliptochloris bilobata TaxID=381761 RepID=A0AAW1QA16_9CHLO